MYVTNKPPITQEEAISQGIHCDLMISSHGIYEFRFFVGDKQAIDDWLEIGKKIIPTYSYDIMYLILDFRYDGVPPVTHTMSVLPKFLLENMPQFMIRAAFLHNSDPIVKFIDALAPTLPFKKLKWAFKTTHNDAVQWLLEK
jgi:hypothetical protein